jgi:hypothetical protein
MTPVIQPKKTTPSSASKRRLSAIDLDQMLVRQSASRVVQDFGGRSVMRVFGAQFIKLALKGLILTVGLTTPTRADTGSVRVVFTKGGFIIGVGGGEGVLTFRGHHYRFNVSGMSVGFTIGASTTQLAGHALNLRSPSDIQGNYAVIGAGGALAAGAGGVQLQNEKGVILQLAGGKVGVELSAAVGGVTIALK